jgi:alpha-1,2-mannosyltransferase
LATEETPRQAREPARSRERLVILLVGAIYAAVVVPIGVHKGGDLVTEFVQVERWLSGAPLYDRTAYLGVWWPPFGVLTVVPFTLLAHANVALAKGAWALLSAAAIVWSVAHTGRRWGWIPAVLAILAVSKPIQTNAEALNVNAVLLALLIAAVVDLRQGRDTRAGLWIGAAAALKAFPALLLAYLAYRRHWRAFAVGVATAVSLTAAVLLRYGPAGAIATFQDWLALSSGVRVPEWARQAQSIEALVLRLDGSAAAALVARLAALLTAAWAIVRLPGRREDALYEIGLVTLVAVLVSPVAWDHYYTLFFAAWLALLTGRAPARSGAIWRMAVLLAGIVTSGIVLAVIPTWLRWELQLRSLPAWGAVLLFLLLVLQRAHLPRREPHHAAAS